MSMTSTSTPETRTYDVTNYGGLVDAIGGVVTVVLAIIALAGVNPPLLLAIATVVFGAALLIQAGTMLSEYTHMIFPAGAAAPVEEFTGGGLSTLFLVGAAGIVLGVLALVGIHPIVLTSVAVIAFGSALVFSSNAVWHLHRTKQAGHRMAGQRPFDGSEILANEMAAGSAGLQCIAGLAAVVLGILAVTGTNATALSLIGLLVAGATILLTGSTLSGVVQGFMVPATGNTEGRWSRTPAA